MDLLRRPNANMALLLLSLVFIKTCNNHNFLALASPSGGVMGGSFFDDSDSSSSQSSLNDHSRYQHYDSSQPSVDDNTPSNNDDGGVPSVFLFFMFGLVLVGLCKHRNGNAISVIKVQVAMLGGKKGSSIQRDLSRIAQAADTSSPEGVSNLLIETILALHQNPSHCIAGYSYVDLKLSREDGEKCYTQLSHEERAKFDRETLVNFNGKEKISTRNQSANVFINDDEYTLLDEEKKPEEEKKLLLNGFGNEFIVITILVAAKGTHKLPSINGAEDLKRTLQKLRSLLSKHLLAGEVLWTPQKDDDTLSEEELIEDYPKLAKSMGNFLAKKKE